MNPTTPTSAMSQGATLMRPRAMARGQVDAWISAYAEPFYIRS